MFVAPLETTAHRRMASTVCSSVVTSLRPTLIWEEGRAERAVGKCLKLWTGLSLLSRPSLFQPFLLLFWVL
jgi:hypothetical protein